MTADDAAILRSRAANTSAADVNTSSSGSTGWMIGFFVVSIIAVAFAGLALWLFLKGRQPAQDSLPLTSSQPAHDEPPAPEPPKDAAASPVVLAPPEAATPATEKPTPDTAAQAQTAEEAGKDDTAPPVVLASPEASAAAANEPKASSNTEAATPATEKPTPETGKEDDDDDGGSSEDSNEGKNAKDVDF